MGIVDGFGNPVTLDCAQSGSAIEAFTQGLVGSESRVVQILQAGQDDGCAIVQAYCAALHLFAESPAGRAAAVPYLKRAVEAAAQATAREQMLTAAIVAWSEGDSATCLALHKELASRYPRDLTSIKIGQYHHFNRGDCTGMLKLGLEGFSERMDLAWAWGIAAFGYEQCDQLDLAERCAHRALELRRSEPWAHHALAHVLLTQGRLQEGLAFMRSVAPLWVDLNSFMLTHNWWHVALFALELDDLSEALALHDERVHGVAPDYSQDQINEVSLLARIELSGGDVGTRWQALAARLQARIHDHVQPFLDLHYLYGLARAERPEAEAMLESIIAHAHMQHDSERVQAWQHVCVPAAQGLLAHARGRYREAVDALSKALPQMVLIGGSHAQRDLFERIWIDALTQAGQRSAAHHVLAGRARAMPASRLAARTRDEVWQRMAIPDPVTELCAAATAAEPVARSQSPYPKRAPGART
jgi:tetratricopeptide (TPR) repeat protein